MKNTLLKAKRAVAAATTGAAVFMYSTLPAMAQLISPTDQPGRLAEAAPGGSFRDLLLTFLNFFLGFLGLVAVIMVIYGGVLYVTAAGNQENIDKGKKIIMYAVVGIVIILLAFALVNTLLTGLGAGGDV